METIRERLTRLEAVVGQIPEHEGSSLNERLELAMELVESAAGQYVELAEDASRKLQVLNEEISVLRRAVSNIPAGVGSSKPRLPEPKPFDGVRSSKELENFLWDMEQYFSVAKVDLGEQVDITAMYLIGDAKLWWRTRIKDDLNAGRPKIDIWDRLKMELNEQFLPNNTS